MGYFIRPVKSLEKKLVKLAKRDSLLYRRVMKKLAEIAENPNLYKPLRNVMKGEYRVQVGHFVIIYSIEEVDKIIDLKDIEHHDKVYEK
jgi:mRNA-degrading endonuclease RelE of RelBE toxin-antitoxin system